MLLPFDFAILTVNDARLLMNFIENQTNTKAFSPNYEKMQKLGVMEIYDKLREFVDGSLQYTHELRTLEQRGGNV